MLSLPLLIACADITPIEDGRTLGPVTTMKDWFTSAYLLPTGAGPVVFDAGYRERNGVSPDEVIAVLVTHGHTDQLEAGELLTFGEHTVEVFSVPATPSAAPPIS